MRHERERQSIRCDSHTAIEVRAGNKDPRCAAECRDDLDAARRHEDETLAVGKPHGPTPSGVLGAKDLYRRSTVDLAHLSAPCFPEYATSFPSGESAGSSSSPGSSVTDARRPR